MPIGDVSNINDTPVGSTDYRPPVDPTVTPTEGDILTFNSTTKTYYPAPGVQTNGFIVTDDAGDGTVADDLNNTDFTGQDPHVGRSAHIVLASINTFVHKAVAYNWVGPTDVLVGLDGNYTATAADLTGVGTSDHKLLVSRSDADSHPTSAITGLDQKQSDQDAATALVQSNLDQTNLDVQALDVRVTQNEADISTNATNISSNDVDIAANAAEIVRVQGELDTDEANLAAHLADLSDECHDQYATEAAALAAFTAAGYGGIGVNTVTAMPAIGAAWVTLTGFDLPLLSTPKGVVQDLGNNALSFNIQGVWQFSIKVSMAFDEAQAGRAMLMRTYNSTTQTGGNLSFNYFVGRNQSGVNLNVVMAVDIPAEAVGQPIQLQVSSSADSFTNVSNIGTVYQAVHISEAKFL